MKQRKNLRPTLNPDRVVTPSTPLDRVAIVERHTAALVAELKQHGYNAVGIAGCIVFQGEDPDKGSPSHIFYQIDGDVVTGDGQPVDRDAFMADVVVTMGKSLRDDKQPVQ